jgi:hypothetical protein
VLHDDEKNEDRKGGKIGETLIMGGQKSRRLWRLISLEENLKSKKRKSDQSSEVSVLYQRERYKERERTKECSSPSR